MRPEVESGASVEWVEQHLQFKFLNSATLWKVGKWLNQSGRAKGVKLRDSSQINEEWSAQTGAVQAYETSLW